MITSYFIDLAQQWVLLSLAATVVAFLAREFGLLHAGAAGVMGVGAYTVAILVTRMGISPQAAMLATIPAGVVMGTGMYLLLRRLSGDALALSTLALGIIAHGIMLNAEDLTGGAMGLAGVPKWVPVTASATLDGILLLAATLAMVSATQRSAFLARINALRDDEVLAVELGLKAETIRLILFLICNTILAVAGGGLAFHLRFVDPSSFSAMESVSILSMALLVPSSRIFAAPLGTAIFVAIPEALRFVNVEAAVAGELRQIIFGAALLGVIVGFRPKEGRFNA